MICASSFLFAKSSSSYYYHHRCRLPSIVKASVARSRTQPSPTWRFCCSHSTLYYLEHKNHRLFAFLGRFHTATLTSSSSANLSNFHRIFRVFKRVSYHQENISSALLSRAQVKCLSTLLRFESISSFCLICDSQ